MKHIILISWLFISACNAGQNQVSSLPAIKDSASVRDTGDLPGMNGCYTSIIKKDTATLHINFSGSEVSGDLVYKRFEKDGNVGTLKGKVQDSLIIADYTFESEGITSVREVVFKMRGDNLIEGYGDIKMNGDTARFKDHFKLKYLDRQPFVKVACK